MVYMLLVSALVSGHLVFITAAQSDKFPTSEACQDAAAIKSSTLPGHEWACLGYNRADLHMFVPNMNGTWK
jgi:hypothetical protein